MPRVTKRTVLEKAYNILGRRAYWTQERFARTEGGVGCDATSKGAKSFCALGAMNRARFDLRVANNVGCDADRLLQDSLPEGERLIVHYNDNPSRKYGEIRAWFRRAIKLAGG